MIARKLDLIVTESEQGIVGQHLPGRENIIADPLTYQGDERSGEERDGNGTHPLAQSPISNKLLTQRFHQHFKQLIPRSFAVSQIPEELGCFALQVIQTIEFSIIRRQKQTKRTAIEFGDNGNASAETKP